MDCQSGSSSVKNSYVIGSQFTNQTNQKENQIKLSCSEISPKLKHSNENFHLFSSELFWSRFCFSKLIGKGGQGKIYSGYELKSNKPIVVKITKCVEYIINDDKLIPREVYYHTTAAVNNPGVLKIIDWFVISDEVAIVMEKMENSQDLFQFVKSTREGLSELESWIIFKQVIAALQKCEENGISHGDVKESNIIINKKTLEIRLIDFGCAVDISENKPKSISYQSLQLRDQTNILPPTSSKKTSQVGISKCELLTQPRSSNSFSFSIESIHRSDVTVELPPSYERNDVIKQLGMLLIQILYNQPLLYLVEDPGIPLFENAAVSMKIVSRPCTNLIKMLQTNKLPISFDDICANEWVMYGPTTSSTS